MPALMALSGTCLCRYTCTLWHLNRLTTSAKAYPQLLDLSLIGCRQTPLRHIIPFDDAISFHQGAGVFGVFLAIVHSLCHIVNFIS